MRLRPIALALCAVLAACQWAPSTPPAPTNAYDGSAEALALATASPPPPPNVGGCQIFPADNPWNTNISKYPLDPNSANYMHSILTDGGPTTLHPDFGHNAAYGIPFIVVPQSQPLVPVTFNDKAQSDPGPYPIPANAPIEGGSKSNGDRHVLVLQQGACKLYELWRGFPQNGGTSWKAGSGALFDLSSDALRHDGWTSADAAGLPVFPALVKCQEIAAGAIHHALRVTFSRTQAGYIHPATHDASSYTNVNYPPMGLRLRLKASYNIASFNRVSQIILRAMKNYGLFVADNGTDWYFQGEGTGNKPASCWNDEALSQLKSVPGSAFEVVQTGTVQH